MSRTPTHHGWSSWRRPGHRIFPTALTALLGVLLALTTSCQGPSSTGKPYFAVEVYYQVLASAPTLSGASGSGSHAAGTGKRWIVFCINEVRVIGTGDGDEYPYEFDPRDLYLTGSDVLVFDGPTSWAADAAKFSILDQPLHVPNLGRVLARVNVVGMPSNAARLVSPHLQYRSKENGNYVESVVLIQQPPPVTPIENISSGNILTPSNIPGCEIY